MESGISYRAIAKYLPISAHKVRPVAKHVRRVSCDRALAVLDAMPQKGALLIKKVLKSAIANAMDRNNKVDETTLYVSELIVNEGPQAKRMWARSRGRADRLIKRSSHILVVVSEKGSK
ncbi:MAG: 50S ribosomal protein L22 [Spirochaetia bacterium]